MNRWWWLIGLLAAGAIGAGVYRAQSKSLPVQVAEVSRGEIREYVDERGKTRLPETHLITMPFAGRIEAIEWEVGQSVTVGQVLARISMRDLDDEIAEAKAAVERLQASIAENADTSVEDSTREQAELFVESMVSTVAAAEAQKVAGKSRLDYSEIFLGRTRNLAESGAETQDDLDRAELNYVESQVGYREDVLNAEAIKSMQSATNLLPRIVREYILRKGLTGAVLAKQKEEAEARLRQALLRRERSEMKCPVDGVILERLVRDEQFLTGGTTLLRIGEPDRLEVEADILSEDVVRIRAGGEVEVYGPAIGATVGQGVPATVGRIYPSGFTKISSLGVEQQRVKVIIQFAGGELDTLREEHALGVDYRVRVRIFTAEQQDAMLTPRSALFRGPAGKWQVFAVRSGLAKLQPVTIGLMNDEHAAVADGLTDGDLVIVAPESNVQDNLRVQPVER